MALDQKGRGMMLDLALGLSALIWFSAMILPVYGFVTGFKSRLDLMRRASVLVAGLMVVLLLLEAGLSMLAKPAHVADLTLLKGYRFWLVFGVVGGMALGWGLFGIGKWVRARV